MGSAWFRNKAKMATTNLSCPPPFCAVVAQGQILDPDTVLPSCYTHSFFIKVEKVRGWLPDAGLTQNGCSTTFEKGEGGGGAITRCHVSRQTCGS